MMKIVSKKDFLDILRRAMNHIHAEYEPPRHDQMTLDEELVHLCIDVLRDIPSTEPEAIAMQLNYLIANDNVVIAWQNDPKEEKIEEEEEDDESPFQDLRYSDQEQSTPLLNTKTKKIKPTKQAKKAEKAKKKTKRQAERQQQAKWNAYVARRREQNRLERIRLQKMTPAERKAEQYAEKLAKLRKQYRHPPFVMKNLKNLCQNCQITIAQVDQFIMIDHLMTPENMMKRFERQYFDNLINGATPHAINKALHATKIKHVYHGRVKSFQAQGFPLESAVRKAEFQWNSLTYQAKIDRMFREFTKLPLKIGGLVEIPSMLRLHYLQSKKNFMEEHKQMIFQWRNTLLRHFTALKSCQCQQYTQQAAAIARFLNVFDWHRVQHWQQAVHYVFSWFPQNERQILRKNANLGLGPVEDGISESEQPEVQEPEMKNDEIIAEMDDVMQFSEHVDRLLERQMAQQFQKREKALQIQRQEAAEREKRLDELANEAERKKREEQRLLRRSDEEILAEVKSRNGMQVTDLEYAALERLGQLRLVMTRLTAVNYGEIPADRRNVHWTLNGMPQK